jgi:RNA polymerase sigma factor (sigma-70 family)
MHRQHHKSDGSGPPTEAVLFRQAQAGCGESLNCLMEMHDGLVHAVVRKQVLGDLPYAEAVQEGRIGLWRAVLKYDPDRGYAFSTYAWRSIVHHIWRAVKVHARASRTEHVEPGAAWCSEWLSVACADPAVLHTVHSVRRALHDLLTRLSERLQRIIVARYGLDGQRTRFYREIGKHLGVSGERARQLHTEALVWLRHPAHSQHLRSLLQRHSLADYEWAAAQAQRWLRRRGGRHGRP